MSDPKTKPKKGPIGTNTKTTSPTTTTTNHEPLESDSHSHSEWIQSALSIIQDGREAELQHRQSVTDMKAMAETLAMQAPFSKTIREVLTLVQYNEIDAAGQAFVEGVLWDVIDELTGSSS